PRRWCLPRSSSASPTRRCSWWCCSPPAACPAPTTSTATGTRNDGHSAMTDPGMIVESAFLPSRAHLIIAPVLLPLVTAAIMLRLGERRRRINSLVNIGSTLAGLVIAVVLMQWVHRGSAPGGLD